MARDFQPMRWRPPAAPPLERDLAPNVRLRDGDRWDLPGAGPEDVAIVTEGPGVGIYCGTEDGVIWRFGMDGAGPERVAEVAGRPLGIEVLADDALIVCVADVGLVRVGLAAGDVDVLVEQVEGQPLVVTNNATVHPDGRIFFTDSSARHPLARYEDDLLEHAGTGRLCVLTPSGDTSVVLGGLQFANGVTLHPETGDVLVAETGSYRIRRVTVDGPEAGRTEVFADNLPGFPDNLSTGPLGIVWVGLASPRQARVDRLATMPGFVKHAVLRLPQALKPSAGSYGFVVGLDGDGRVVANLQDPDGDVARVVTGMREHDGRLYVGSLKARWLVVLDLHESDFSPSS